MSSPTFWDPASLLIDSPNHPQSRRIAVVVLNQPIANVDVFLSVCSRAHLILAADGGANRIRDLHLSEAQRATCTPHAIIGDLDSLRDNVRTYFAARGVTITQSSDQESTDFGKAMRYVRDNTAAEAPLDIALFGGLGGRADHAFAQLNDLYRESHRQESRLFLLTAESIIFLLAAGQNVTKTPRSKETFGENVGVIPLGCPATLVRTKGLEWDVSDYKTQFGGNVSTSNHIRSDTVEIETSERVLFTMEFALKPHP